MPVAVLKGVSLHYELSGTDSGPVLILSNSLGVNLAMWDRQVDALHERFRILRYDTRGHGTSSVPSGPYTIDQLGVDVLRLADALNISKFSFCGLSMGGATGQWLGIHAPHRLSRLVLANTSPRFGTLESWNGRIATVEQEGLDAVIPGTLERWFAEGFRTTQPETIAATAAMLRTNNVRGYLACCAAIRDADFRELVEEIRVPTLVIAGSHDPVSPPADGIFLRDKIGGAQYVELDAAHLSNVEAAAEFNSSLTGFLGA
jgi:3-oxoadipate enol-lactonase